MIFEKEGKTYIKGRAVSEKDVGIKRLEMFNKYAVNQPLLYRHVHPEANEKANVFGRIVESKIVEDAGNHYQEIVAELFDKTKAQRNHVEYCKATIAAGKPVGFSPGWEQYGDENSPSEMQVYEYSTTYIPHCDSCRATKVFKMEDKEKQEYEAKIAELQTALNEIVGKNKTYEAEKKQYEDKVKATVESIHKEYEAKFTSLTEEIVKSNKAMELIKEEARVARIEPTIQKIAKIQKTQAFVSDMRKWDEKKINETYEELRKLSPPEAYTETMEEAQHKAQEMSSKTKELEDFRKRMDEKMKEFTGAK